MDAASPGPDVVAARVPLTPGDERLLDAPPLLALLRLSGPADPDVVRASFAARAPGRLAAHVVPGEGAAELRVDRSHLGHAVVDLPGDRVDRCLGVDVPLERLAGLGLGDVPARAPLCTLVHLRTPDGDALALRVSHAAGDGIGLLRLLGAVLDDLRSGRAPAGAPAPTAPVDAAFSRGRTDRRLSVLPLSPACLREIDDVRAAGTGASPTVCRMAVVARRLAPLVLPVGEPLRIRIPVDLRHRRLGIPSDAAGNQWFDALALPAGPHEALPSAAELAREVDRTIRARVAELTPADVDHREDQSLRLRRAVPGEPLRRGLDLVHSSLPTPAWPGVRGLHVLGSASLGVLDQRGAAHVDVVTPRPLPSGVAAL